MYKGAVKVLRWESPEFVDVYRRAAGFGQLTIHLTRQSSPPIIVKQ